jgi:hypothetical protein
MGKPRTVLGIHDNPTFPAPNSENLWLYTIKGFGTDMAYRRHFAVGLAAIEELEQRSFTRHQKPPG